MARRDRFVMLLLLGMAVGLWFLLRPRVEQEADPPPDADAPAAPAPGQPTLRVPVPKSAEPAIPTYPSEDAWLEAWDPKEGLPTGRDRLRGVVVDPGGRPVFDARVYLRSKPGQPAVIDAPWHWSARTDKDGRFVFTDTWAARSVLCAWAPGHERACVDEVTTADEVRVVLAEAPAVMVVVRPPVRTSRFPQADETIEPRVRVRLVGEQGNEHPRGDEPLAAGWEHLVEPNVPTPVRIPRDAMAHLTVDAPFLACDPPFAAVPNAAKELVFRLVESGHIGLCLVDAASGARVPWSNAGGSFHAVTHVASGFRLDRTSESIVFDGPGMGSVLGHDTGVVVGDYRIDVRRRGYVVAEDTVLVSIEHPGQRVQVDVPLGRDPTRAILHLEMRHAASTQRANHEVEGVGPVFVRRREDSATEMRRVALMTRSSGGQTLRVTLEDLAPGTYDVLAWDGTGWTVGHHLGLRLEGGTERTLEMDLFDGYGFRPADVAALGVPRMLQLRAECDALGVLPWLPLRSHPLWAEKGGFVITDGRGYIGPYPFEKLTIVRRPPQGRLQRHALAPAIRPPDSPSRR